MQGFKEGYEYWTKNNTAYVGGANTNEWINSINSEVDKLIDDLNSFEGYKTSTDQLSGDIAEFFHSGTFNISAAIRRSENRTAVDRSHDLGSADITSNFGKEFGLKYYKNGEESAKQQAKSILERFYEYKANGGKRSYEEYLTKNGLDPTTTDPNIPLYQNQTRIIPDDQLEEANRFLNNKIANESSKRPEQVQRYEDTKNNLDDRIRDDTGVESKTLSRKESKEIANDAKKGEISAEKYGFDAASMTETEFIMKEAAKSGIYAAIFSIILKELPNLVDCIGKKLSGEDINREDFLKYGFDALESGTEGFIRGSVTGAIVAYCKLGKFGELFKGASPQLVGTLSVLVFDTIKNSILLNKGDINNKDFSDRFISESLTSMSSLSAGTLGQLVIPIPVIGYIAGSLIGSVIFTTIWSTGDNWENSYKYNALYFQKYYSELLNINMNAFEGTSHEYAEASRRIEVTSSESELNRVLLNIYKDMNIKKPWHGEFDEFMSNRDNHLVFE